MQHGTVSSADRLSQGVIAWRRASWPQMREIPSKNKCKKSTKKEKRPEKIGACCGPLLSMSARSVAPFSEFNPVAEPVRWSMARRASGPARPIRCPVAMRRLRASRSTHPPHLPVGAPRPSGRELGRSRDRTSAIRPSRVDMCGRACTTRTRAAARARIVAGRIG